MTETSPWRPYEIKIGLGLGSIDFGVTMEKVQRELGSCGEERVFDDGDKHLYFDDLGLAFFFSADDGNRLSSIEASDRSRCHLCGRRLFGEPIVVVVDAVRSSLASAIATVLPTFAEEPDETELRFSEISLNLYFNERKRLRSIQWGPFPTGT